MNSFSDISRKCISPNMMRAGNALIIFSEMHFLLISENEFYMKSNVTDWQVSRISCGTFIDLLDWPAVAMASML